MLMCPTQARYPPDYLLSFLSSPHPYFVSIEYCQNTYGGNMVYYTGMDREWVLKTIRFLFFGFLISSPFFGFSLVFLLGFICFIHCFHWFFLSLLIFLFFLWFFVCFLVFNVFFVSLSIFTVFSFVSSVFFHFHCSLFFCFIQFFFCFLCFFSFSFNIFVCLKNNFLVQFKILPIQS